MTILQAALHYASQGWRVFPLNGKTPFYGFAWKDLATTDSMTLAQWWSKWPNANVGLACGSGSGVWVVDIDPRHGGDVSMEERTLEHGLYEPIAVSRTGGADGGEHHFFAWNPDRPVGCPTKTMPGIDVKGEGGYVVLPPSIHPETGDPYEWR